MMIGQMVRRMASAVTSQPATSASPHVTNGSDNGDDHPTMNTTIARRMAGACQPSHRWYKVVPGTPVIV